MSSEYDELLSPVESSSGAQTSESAATPVQLPPSSESQQEPHNFTEKEVGEYKETDRYLPVRVIGDTLLTIHFCLESSRAEHSPHFGLAYAPLQYPHLL